MLGEGAIWWCPHKAHKHLALLGRCSKAQRKDPSWAVQQELQSRGHGQQRTHLRDKQDTAEPPGSPWVTPQAGETTAPQQSQREREAPTFEGAQLQGPFPCYKHTSPSCTGSASSERSEIVTDHLSLCPDSIIYQNYHLLF